MIYKHSLLLHKLYNDRHPLTEWTNLNFQHQFSMRQGQFTVAKTNKYKIGENILVNRLSVVNNLIPLDWLNLSYATYKLKCKEKFVTVKRKLVGTRLCQNTTTIFLKVAHCHIEFCGMH
jgi:hypothetical protein